MINEEKSIIGMALSWVRIRARLLLGGLFNLAGIPGLVRECRYDSSTANAEITVKQSPLFTIISVNGLDIYFHRLTGSIDGVGTSDCRQALVPQSVHSPALTASTNRNAQKQIR